jgi:hypothetical protein
MASKIFPNHLTSQRISLIDTLVQNMCLEGEPVPDRMAQLDAANFAALRCISNCLSETELRAIIYDRLFPAEYQPEAA